MATALDLSSLPSLPSSSGHVGQRVLAPPCQKRPAPIALPEQLPDQARAHYLSLLRSCPASSRLDSDLFAHHAVRALVVVVFVVLRSMVGREALWLACVAASSASVRYLLVCHVVTASPPPHRRRQRAASAELYFSIQSSSSSHLINVLIATHDFAPRSAPAQKQALNVGIRSVHFCAPWQSAKLVLVLASNPAAPALPPPIHHPPYPPHQALLCPTLLPSTTLTQSPRTSARPRAYVQSRHGIHWCAQLVD